MRMLYKYILLLMLLIPSYVFAGNITINKYNVSMYPGGSVNFNIAASSAAGEVTITSANTNIATVSETHFWMDNDSKSITIKGNSVGTTTISVSINASDYDEKEIITTYKIVVYVNEKTTTTTTTTTTTKSVSNNTTVRNTEATKRTNNTTKTTTKVISVDIPIEQSVEETTTTTTTEVVKEEIIPSLKSLKIVGYNLDFKENQTNYSLTIPNDLKELYIITEKDSNISVNEGIINVEDKDFVELKVLNNETNKTRVYKINLVKKEYKEKKNCKSVIYLILIIVLFVSFVTCIIFILKKMLKKKTTEIINTTNNVSNVDELEYRNDYFE